MDRIVAGEGSKLFESQRADAERRKQLRANAVKPKHETAVAVAERSDVARDNPVPPPPFWGRRKVTPERPDGAGVPVHQRAPVRGPVGLPQEGHGDAEYEKLLDELAPCRAAPAAGG